MITQEYIDTLVEIKSIQDKVNDPTNISLTKLTKYLNFDKDILTKIYNRLVEISAQRLTLNKFLTKYDSTLHKEIMLTLNLIHKQEIILDGILHSNLSAQSIKMKDLLSQQQKNSMNHFNSLVAAAAKRLKLNPSKETLEKDCNFLQKKFYFLPEKGVSQDLVADAYCQVVNQMYTRIEESV